MNQVRSICRSMVGLSSPFGLGWLLVWVGTSGSACGQDEKAELPKFPVIRNAVVRHFASMPNFQPGDIVSQSNVRPVFDHLRQMGWTVAQRKAILALVLEDKDFLVRQLRTDNGRKFMRRIAKYPSAYDRLYRLAAMRGGRRTVVDMIQAKDGYKMIEYLTTSKGGKNLGRLLGNVPKGSNFNRPTGKIFSVDSLVVHLKTSYEAESKRRSEN